LARAHAAADVCGVSPLLSLLLATLPLLIAIQSVATALSRRYHRRHDFASPHGAAVRGLIKALDLHPLTISFSIEVTATDLPRLTLVREISKAEVDSITKWIHDGNIQTVQETHTLQPH
jgi:hypothetical protein